MWLRGAIGFLPRAKPDNVRLLGLNTTALLLGSRFPFSLQLHGRINPTVQNSMPHYAVTILNSGAYTGKKMLLTVEPLPCAALPLRVCTCGINGTSACQKYGIIDSVP